MMATNIPAKLKTAGITSFIVRANQLRNAKPVISYWCDYWVVNQILAKQLHHADEECLEFTTALMDQLEQAKIDHAGNTAILNDDEGKVAVEQFAQETFERALRPLKADKVTQQTAITFEAAATFLQLMNIWGTPDAEAEKKIKFSKWNAARILRAIKEGKDPNESNPKFEEEEQVAEDDPELQAIMSGQPRPATVEDAPDEEGRGNLDPTSRAAISTQYSPGLVSAPTSPPQDSAHAPEQVSPIAPQDSVAPDDYFPSAPVGTDRDNPLNLPSAPGAVDDPDMSIPSPPTVPSISHNPTTQPSAAFSPPTLADTPNDFYQPSAPTLPTSAPSQPSLEPFPTPRYPPNAPFQQTPRQPQQPVVPTFSPPTSRSLPAAQTPPVTQPYGGGPPTNAVYNADDAAIAKAQKHAKWAISALNFEDVPTAVLELKAALQALGAK